MSGEEKIHVWVRNSSEDGWARTACGILAPEGMTTRDRNEVTCFRAGCRQEETPFRVAEEKIAHARDFNMCSVCFKQSDASKVVDGITLCGTHCDEWLRSSEIKHVVSRGPRSKSAMLLEFISRRQAEIRNHGRKS